MLKPLKREDQWQTLNWSCGLKANERPRKNCTQWRKTTNTYTDRQTDGHGDYYTYSAKNRTLLDGSLMDGLFLVGLFLDRLFLDRSLLYIYIYLIQNCTTTDNLIFPVGFLFFWILKLKSFLIWCFTVFLSWTDVICVFNEVIVGNTLLHTEQFLWSFVMWRLK